MENKEKLIDKGDVIPTLQVERIKKYFPVRGGIFLSQKGAVHAVDDVSFYVKKGETLGLVGESGCGKTTLGRCVMGLYPLSDGIVRLNGHDISKVESINRERASGEGKNLKFKMQMIFQDPFESLNSRHTVGEILQEKYIIHNRFGGNIKYGRDQIKGEIIRLLERVGLSPDSMTKFPHEFSGGQRQRIGIARAISLAPEVLICDEPVSALDVSVQSQILNLLLRLQNDMGLTSLFISHDLAVVRHISDRIAVMYLGKIVEMADSDAIYSEPKHPYTEALLSAIPVLNPEARRKRIILKGEIPSPINPPKGCRFHTRCRYVMDICKNEAPLLRLTTNSILSHFVACHLDSL